MKNFKAGTKVNQGHYTAFIPALIHQNWELEDMELISLLSEADQKLGKLDMFANYVNIELFISMYLAKEATQSSRIEGTQTEMEEVFMSESMLRSEKRADWQEVQNYITAMKITVAQLEDLPFSCRLIRKAHEKILYGVRGEHKQPGEFRRSQNWVGGASLKDAVFVPPPFTEIPSLMSDIEKFANDEENRLPHLLKAALMHYQFETIHPFLDGNGRVGRLMIPIYLISKGVLTQPILYLSDFFERHRTLYYDNLMRVRTHDDITQWYKFFLTGIIETASKGIQTFDRILKLQKEVEGRILSLGSRAKDARLVMDALYQAPIIDATQIAKITGKSNVSTYKLIADLEHLNILQEMTGGQRGRVYRFKEYLALFEN